MLKAEGLLQTSHESTGNWGFFLPSSISLPGFAHRFMTEVEKISSADFIVSMQIMLKSKAKIAWLRFSLFFGLKGQQNVAVSHTDFFS